jgi:hypothetical protein
MHYEPLNGANDEPSVLVAGSVPRFAGATKSPAAGAGAPCPARRLIVSTGASRLPVEQISTGLLRPGQRQ